MDEKQGKTLLEIVRVYNGGFEPKRQNFREHIVDEARQAVELLIREMKAQIQPDLKLIETAQGVLAFIVAGQPVPAP